MAALWSNVRQNMPHVYKPCCQSNITKANDMVHNLLCNTDKKVSDVCCVQAPAVAPSGLEQQLNRIRNVLPAGNQGSDAWRTSQRWKVHTLIWSVTANMAFSAVEYEPLALLTLKKNHLIYVFKSRSTNLAYSGWFTIWKSLAQKRHQKHPSKDTLRVWSANERFPWHPRLLQLTQCLCAA